MNDVAASIGIVGLKNFDHIMEHRDRIWEIYEDNELPLVTGRTNVYGYACLLVDSRDRFAYEMEREGIETNIMHVRNDRYALFKRFARTLPSMDAIDERYICIPMHNDLSLKDAEKVACKARLIMWQIGGIETT